ncbi:MAG TPA: branched-chain alpha-keto acid dehydrogenase subunit E2, partial [Deltaproteobacteria bacterium]|nr:branched-chain alpha-keto acid dehydrogenase subunit E2 [Deltaproteobacteria bacterium]
MEFELRLPDVGEGIAEGEIVRWLVSEGDRVAEDDLLVEVLTDKANVEIPSPVSGTVSRIVAQPGQVVKVGEVMAVLEVVAPSKTPAAPPDRGEALAVPAVRKLARDLGVELSSVRGTGQGGRVTERDVRAAAGRGPGRPGKPAPETAPGTPRPDEERIPFRGKRRMAARKMSLSKSTIPHALLVDEADVTSLLGMREALRGIGETEGVRITVLPLILKAVAAALERHPAMNATLDEERGEIVRYRRYDIGIAVDAEDGLVVPVLRNARGKSVVELAREMERLAEGARSGKLGAADFSGSTFTVTSIGSIGGLFSYPIINVPEAAILAAHKIVTRP